MGSLHDLDEGIAEPVFVLKYVGNQFEKQGLILILMYFPSCKVKFCGWRSMPQEWFQQFSDQSANISCSHLSLLADAERGAVKDSEAEGSQATFFKYRWSI